MINNAWRIGNAFGAPVLAAAEALDEMGTDQPVLDVLDLSVLAGEGAALHRAVAMASMTAQAVWREVGAQEYAAAAPGGLVARLEPPRPNPRLDRLQARKAALNALIEAIRVSPEVAELAVMEAGHEL